MPHNVTQVPRRWEAASGPVSLAIENDRRLVTAYVGASAVITVNGLAAVAPADLVNYRLLVWGREFRFTTASGNPDDLNSTLIQIPLSAGTPTDADLARAIWVTLSSNGNLASTVAVDNALGSPVLELQQINGAALGGLVEAYDQANVGGTSGTTGIAISNTGGTTPVAREGYRFVAEAFVEPYHYAGNFTAQARLQRAALLGLDSAAPDRFAFDFAAVLAPALGFDVPSLTRLQPQVLARAVARWFWRYAESFGSNADALKFFYQVDNPVNAFNPEDPGDVLGGGFNAVLERWAFNAQFDVWDRIPRWIDGTDDPPPPGAPSNVPANIQAYASNGGQRAFFSPFRSKDTYVGALEFLAAWVPEVGAEFYQVRLAYQLRVGAQVVSGESDLEFAVANLRDPYGALQGNADANNHLLLVPVHYLWGELDFTGVQSFCIWLLLAPFDAPNEYPYDDGGTFEDGNATMTFAVNPDGGLGGPAFSLGTVAPGFNSAFAAEVVVEVAVDNSIDTVLQLQSPGTVTLAANTTYTLRAVVNVQSAPAFLSPNSRFVLRLVGLSAGATQTVQTAWEDGASPVGAWVAVETQITTGALPVTGTVELVSDDFFLASGVLLWLDDIYLAPVSLATEAQTLTGPFEYVLQEDECGAQYTTFVYQNALGVADTLHLRGDLTVEVSTERETAESLLVRTPNLEYQDFQERIYNAAQRRTFELAATNVTPNLRGRLTEFAFAPRAYLVENVAPETNTCDPEPTQASGPITFADATWNVFSVDVGGGLAINAPVGDTCSIIDSNFPSGYTVRQPGETLEAFLQRFAAEQTIGELAVVEILNGTQILLTLNQTEITELFGFDLLGQNPTAIVCARDGVAEGLVNGGEIEPLRFYQGGFSSAEIASGLRKTLTPIVLTGKGLDLGRVDRRPGEVEIEFAESRDRRVV